MRKLIFLILFSLIITPNIQAQRRVLGFQQQAVPYSTKYSGPYAQQWKKVDSLIKLDLPESAQKQVKSILKQAGQHQNTPEIIKAQLYLMVIAQGKKENAGVANIKESERLIKQSNGVIKALWQSLTAQLYWHYYQSHRYQILHRTALAQNPSKDIKTWPAQVFIDTISRLFLNSLKPPKQLKQVSIKKYAPILIEGFNTFKLRSTLYDLQANTAIDFFKNTETGLTQPIHHFELSGGQWFLPAKSFIGLHPKVKDARALKLHALQLYQALLSFHLNDKSPEAFIDADLNRLNFVHNQSVTPIKDSLYLSALEQLGRQYSDIPAAAQIHYLIAFQKFTKTTQNNNDSNYSLPEIKDDLQKIAQKFPESEGGMNAYNLLITISRKSLSIQTEKVTVPGENILALVNYHNINHVYLRLYRISNKITKRNYRYYQKDYYKTAFGNKPIRQWQQNLPGSKDMKAHSVEIKVNALPTGRYILTISNFKNLKDTNNVISATVFQVSNLSIIALKDYKNPGKLWVLNRTNGRPIKNAKVSFWKSEYSGRNRQLNWQKVLGSRSGNQGQAKTPNRSTKSYAIRVISGKDTFCSTRNYQNYFYNPNHQRNSNHTFYFTDRSIYRPGQTIYFKGIVVKSTDNYHNNDVVPNKNVVVDFYNANHQKIKSLTLTTNEYGSFSGSFTAPEAGLNGRMSLQSAYGHTNISVEEYKRPKFYVDFDTLKGSYALNQKVTVSGFAKSYAGGKIGNATVKYHVFRRARFPYYWAFYRWGQPKSKQQEIAQGTTRTTAAGKFNISLFTQPDRSINPKTLPVFTYTIHVDITDINGETHSGEINVKSGYRSLTINSNLPQQARPADLDSLSILTKNLNGIFVPTKLTVSIAPLTFPGKIYRQRRWDMPDKFVMNEQQFHQAFPLDEYKNEGDYHYWPTEKPVYKNTFQPQKGQSLALSPKIWKKAGWYVLKMTGKDTQGKKVEGKQYVYIVHPKSKQKAEKSLVLVTNKSTFQPGEKAKIWLKCGFNKAYVLQNSSLKNENKSAELSGLIVQENIMEKNRGGIGFSWLYVYHNRVYKASKRLSIPWLNKDLELDWATHHNKVLPGSQETWTLTIKGHNKEKVAAELLAGMYDASLDAFKPHQWSWQTLYPKLHFNSVWNDFGFGKSNSRLIQDDRTPLQKQYKKRYPHFLIIPNSFSRYRNPILLRNAGRPIPYFGSNSSATTSQRIMLSKGMDKKSNLMTPESADKTTEEEISEQQSSSQKDEPSHTNHQSQPHYRKNLRETAFFFPRLHTDKDGNIKFTFTLPEALTTWKFMAFAHTKDWKTGYLEGKIITQKKLMVQPNLPRFFRQGDQLILSTKISNLSGKNLSGTAKLEILNALTLKPVNLPFRLKQLTRPFNALKGKSTEVHWAITIPQSLYTPVIVQVSATANHFTDGVQDAVPVVTNRVLVTETMSLPMTGPGSKKFTFDKLLHSDSLMDVEQGALVNHALTVEYTANPAWYAVQALPYLMEYPYECSEQTFNRFYANALGVEIVAQSPKIAKVFSKWRNEDTVALSSNLEKNQELKTALLTETPWVLAAKSETAQKHHIAELFQTGKLNRNLNKALRKLAKDQSSSGAFPWFKGMVPNRYITQYIITGMAHLQNLGIVAANKGKADDIIRKALPYLDNAIKKDYEVANKSKSHLNIGHLQIQYLYMRSYFKNHPIPATVQPAVKYYIGEAAKEWPHFNPYMKGMIALALNRMGETKTAQQIMASLSETALHDKEMGMYWKQQRSYWWYQSDIESQALLIEAFDEVIHNEKAVNEMKTWLLKQKQTQNWGTTKATSDAVYALLLQGSNWLAHPPEVTMQLGKTTLNSTKINTQSGTGYFKKRIAGKKVHPEMGEITVTVKNTGKENYQHRPSWGGVYWQYFADMDHVSCAETPLKLYKKLYIKRHTNHGPVLTEIKPGNELKVGDKVIVRIILKVDRMMQYVHMKDMRAACFEPVNVLSQYKYQDGLGYYESTKDLSTDFFFDRLPKGTYVFEYPVFVGQKGNFSNGITTIQCLYAPEFSSHSKGIRVEVK